MAVTIERVEALPISKIKCGTRFRKDMGDIEELADNIRSHGLIHPILVRSDMVLLAGERRITACKFLGQDVIRADVITYDTQRESGRREIELYENVMRLNFRWDERAMLEKAIFEEKVREDPKWSYRKQENMLASSKTMIGMRIELAEALELLPELASFETQDEAWKYYKKLEEEVVIGQLRKQVPAEVREAPAWAHDHYVVGDALELMPFILPESADFAEVDPPYGIDIDRRKSRNEDEGHVEDYNEIPREKFPEFMKELLPEVYRILKPNTFAVVWYGMQWHCEMYAWLRMAGFATNPLNALWYKGQVGQTAQPDVALGSVYEPFFLARKGTPKMNRQGRANVFDYSTVPSGKKIHTTEKPIGLLSDIINTMLPDRTGGNILIPFLGSGVTLRAAYKLGHTGIGFDLSEENKARFLEAVAEDTAPVDSDDIDDWADDDSE